MDFAEEVHLKIRVKKKNQALPASPCHLPEFSETFFPGDQTDIDQNLLRQNLNPDGGKNFLALN